MKNLLPSLFILGFIYGAYQFWTADSRGFAKHLTSMVAEHGIKLEDLECDSKGSLSSSGYCSFRATLKQLLELTPYLRLEPIEITALRDQRLRLFGCTKVMGMEDLEDKHGGIDFFLPENLEKMKQRGIIFYRIRAPLKPEISTSVFYNLIYRPDSNKVCVPMMYPYG